MIIFVICKILNFCKISNFSTFLKLQYLLESKSLLRLPLLKVINQKPDISRKIHLGHSLSVLHEHLLTHSKLRNSISTIIAGKNKTGKEFILI